MPLKRITKGNLWGFIQSRPYASVADIRRLFTMDVDGAAPFRTNEGTTYVGLSPEAAELIRQLWQEGRVALDLNPNVKARVVQGVYPARLPSPRHAAPSRPGDSGNAMSGSNAGGAGAEGQRRRRRRKRSGEASAPSSGPARTNSTDPA